MSISKHNKEIYDHIFSDEKRIKEHKILFKTKNKMLISMINKQHKKILDVGCGDGFLGKLIKEKFNSEVHGLDISNKALKTAKKNGIITKKFNLEGKKWPYKNNFFDVVIAGDIIEHLYDTEKFVQEAYRVLKKGGIFLVSTPNINCYYNRLLVLFGKMPIWIEAAPNLIFTPFSDRFEEIYNTGHVRVFNRYSLSKLLKTFGFHVEKIKGVPLHPANPNNSRKNKTLVFFVRKIESLFAKTSRLSSLIIAKAIK